MRVGLISLLISDPLLSFLNLPIYTHTHIYMYTNSSHCTLPSTLIAPPPRRVKSTCWLFVIPTWTLNLKNRLRIKTTQRTWINLSHNVKHTTPNILQNNEMTIFMVTSELRGNICKPHNEPSKSNMIRQCLVPGGTHYVRVMGRLRGINPHFKNPHAGGFSTIVIEVPYSSRHAVKVRDENLSLYQLDILKTPFW